jgi:hypothetical protein
MRPVSTMPNVSADYDLSSEVRDQVRNIRPLNLRGLLAALDFASGLRGL